MKTKHTRVISNVSARGAIEPWEGREMSFKTPSEEHVDVSYPVVRAGRKTYKVEATLGMTDDQLIELFKRALAAMAKS